MAAEQITVGGTMKMKRPINCAADLMKPGDKLVWRFPSIGEKPRATYEEKPYCLGCRAENPRFTCAGCSRARYCSVECQRKDRPIHRPWCAAPGTPRCYKCGVFIKDERTRYQCLKYDTAFCTKECHDELYKPHNEETTNK